MKIEAVLHTAGNVDWAWERCYQCDQYGGAIKVKRSNSYEGYECAFCEVDVWMDMT